MAVVGVLNAVDRGLVTEDDILVHGSGSYAADDFDALVLRDLHAVEDAESLRHVVLDATVL